MTKPIKDFTAVLLRRKLLSAEQIEKARAFQAEHGGRLEDALIQLGDVTAEQILHALAEVYRLPVIDLTAVTVPASVLELVPHSVARENVVLPLAGGGRAIWIALSDPANAD